MRFATFILFCLGHVMLASLPGSPSSAQEVKALKAAPPVPRAKPMLMRDHSAAAAVRTELGKTDTEGQELSEKRPQTRIRATKRDAESFKPKTAQSKPDSPTLASDAEHRATKIADAASDGIPDTSRVQAEPEADLSSEAQQEALRDAAPQTSKAKPLQFSSRREFLALVVKPKPKDIPKPSPQAPSQKTQQAEATENEDQPAEPKTIDASRRVLVRTTRIPTPAPKPQSQSGEKASGTDSIETDTLASALGEDKSPSPQLEEEQSVSVSFRPKQKPSNTLSAEQETAAFEPGPEESKTEPETTSTKLGLLIQPKPKPAGLNVKKSAKQKQSDLEQKTEQAPDSESKEAKQKKKPKPVFAGFLVRKSGYTTPTANGRKPEPFAAHNESFQACLDVLSPYKISFERVPNHRKSNGCQIVNGLKIKSIEGVEMKPAAVLNCDMALRTAKWIQKLQPLAATYFASSVSSIGHMSAYSCRFRSNGKISEHGLGNALDVGSIKFSNGKRSSVLNHWYTDNTPERDAHANFWYQAAGAGCEAYQLLLSPVSNAAHKNHLHLDAGHWRLCER